MQNYNDILSEVLIDEETLHSRIRELGAEISADYPDGNLLLICILRGGVLAGEQPLQPPRFHEGGPQRSGPRPAELLLPTRVLERRGAWLTFSVHPF